MADEPPIGLIAGGGLLPSLTAQGIHAAGRKVACVGFSGFYEPELPEECDYFASVGIVRLNAWVRRFRRWGVREAILIGKVEKKIQYDPFRLFRFLPDTFYIRKWFTVFRYDSRTVTMLTEVANELSSKGIELQDTTKYIPQCMADEGVMTRRQPNAIQQKEIELGLPIVRRLNDLDVGQAIAVREGDVVAVEAIEGTDRMIARAGELCHGGGWTLIKIPNRDHDMRLDVPTVGPDTIENLHKAGGGCLAVAAGRVILADKPQMLELADRYKIAVVGVRIDP